MSGDHLTPFISAHWKHKVIHYCKLPHEPDWTWQHDNWSGSTRLCFLPELCTVADLGWLRNPNRRKSPPLFKKLSLSPSLSPLLPLAVFPSLWQLLMGSFFLAAPSHPSSGSLPFFSSSVDLSPADSLSTVNSFLFQLCLQPALWVWLTTLVLSPAADGLLFFVFPLMHAVFGSRA